MPKFEYKEEKSEIFGKIKRPLINLEVFSAKLNIWLCINDILADTGADICLLPKSIGEDLVADITAGKEVKLKGIVPFSKLLGFIHCIKSIEQLFAFLCNIKIRII